VGVATVGYWQGFVYDNNGFQPANKNCGCLPILIQGFPVFPVPPGGIYTAISDFVPCYRHIF